MKKLEEILEKSDISEETTRIIREIIRIKKEAEKKGISLKEYNKKEPTENSLINYLIREEKYQQIHLIEEYNKLERKLQENKGKEILIIDNKGKEKEAGIITGEAKIKGKTIEIYFKKKIKYQKEWVEGKGPIRMSTKTIEEKINCKNKILIGEEIKKYYQQITILGIIKKEYDRQKEYKKLINKLRE